MMRSDQLKECQKPSHIVIDGVMRITLVTEQWNITVLSTDNNQAH
jgi:hypothetical protein